MYSNLRTDDEAESVHLEDFPELEDKYIDEKLMKKMAEVREVCTLGQSARVESSLKVRQPLASIKMKGVSLDDELLDVVKEELNVQEAEVVEELPDGAEWNQQEGKYVSVTLNTRLTEELKKEGLFRDVVRKIQHARKKAGLKIGEPASIKVSAVSSEVAELVDEKNEEFKEAVYAQSLESTTHKREKGKAEISVTIE
jgi:isoleucyl-tRNA synthetase